MKHMDIFKIIFEILFLALADVIGKRLPEILEIEVGSQVKK